MFWLESEMRNKTRENSQDELFLCQKLVPSADNPFNWSENTQLQSPDKANELFVLPESVAGNTLKFVVEQAATALSQRKLQDREECLGHMQLFQRFHMFSTAIHRFFQELVKESAEFRFNYEYGDEPRQFWARYTLTFGADQYQRNFPIVVTYQRFPSYSTTLKIDVSEIGDTVSGRTRQTDRLTHGRIEHHYSGLFYWAVAPESVQDVPLTLRWLKRTFIEIFKLAYET